MKDNFLEIREADQFRIIQKEIEEQEYFEYESKRINS